MDAEGVWVVTEDISYSAVVANPSDEATAKLEKLKVNDTTYANWTESEIKALAGGSGGKLYRKNINISALGYNIVFDIYSTNNNSEISGTFYGTGTIIYTDDPLNNAFYPCRKIEIDSQTRKGTVLYIDGNGTKTYTFNDSRIFYEIVEV